MDRSPSLAAVCLALAGSTYGAPATDAGPGTQCSVTVVPPGPVSDKASVEVRLAVHNGSDQATEYEVRFFWDTREAAARVHQQPLKVPARSRALASAWVPAAGHVGKRRLLYLVSADGKTVARGSWPLEVLACETTALPIVQGMFYDTAVITYGGYTGPHGATEKDMRDAVDSMHRLGISVFILGYLESSGGAIGPREGLIYYPSEIETELIKPAGLDYDPVETVLAQADRHGMHVFLGNGRGGDLWLLWNGLDDSERVAAAVDLGRRMAREVWTRYGHHPSFYGWYFSHEMSDLPKASRYYDPLAVFCHSLAPDKPVLVCPAGNPTISPEILRKSQVDIFGYQDGVGPGYDGKTYKYTYDAEVRIADLEEIYKGYRAAHEGSGKHIWTDLEIWRGFGEPGKPQKGFRPAPVAEVRRQIEIEAKYVQMIVAYTFSCVAGKSALGGDLGPNGEKATRLYNDYLEYATDRMEALRRQTSAQDD